MPMPKAAPKSSWAAPIQKALLQQRLNKEGGQDLDQLGLSATLQRRPFPINNKMASKNGLVTFKITKSTLKEVLGKITQLKVK